MSATVMMIGRVNGSAARRQSSMRRSSAEMTRSTGASFCASSMFDATAKVIASAGATPIHSLTRSIVSSTSRYPTLRYHSRSV